MKVRALLPWVSAVLAIVASLAAALSASAAPSKSGATAHEVARRHRHRRSERQGLQPALRTSGSSARRGSWRSRAARTSRLGQRLHPEPAHGGAERLRPRDRRRVPDVRAARQGRGGVPEHEVREHRRPVRHRSHAKPSNVRGLIFKEQEAGYLVGYIAGLVVKDQPGADVISAVGANKVPAIVEVHRRVQGGRQAREQARQGPRQLRPGPDVRRPGEVQGDRRSTRSRAARRSSSWSQVSAASARLTAAKERKIWGIGVDADQGFLGKHILTSATKRVDVAVYQTIQAFRATRAGSAAASTRSSTSRTAASAYGKLSTRLPKAKRKEYGTKVEKIRKLIASGKIKPPTK